MRRYLKEFLSDKRVIEWPRLIWLPVLYGIVLDTRPKKSGAKYDNDLEPRAQRIPRCAPTPAPRARGSARDLRSHPEIVVEWGMRYGQPVDRKRAGPAGQAGLQRILMFPLYPQYSATTTATVNDKFFRALIKMRYMPAMRSVPPYYDEAVYIDALARSIEKHLCRRSTSSLKCWSPPITAFRRAYFKRGDPYPCHCWKTTRLLRERLGWGENKLITMFPVAFRPAGMDAALHGQDGGETGAATASNRSRSSIRAFPPIASKRWRRSTAKAREIFHARRRRQLHPYPLPQRQRRGHEGDRGAGPPRDCGLGIDRSKSSGISKATCEPGLIVTATIHA